MKFKLRQHFQIESARSLPFVPKGHPCGNTHGHSFKIIVTFIGSKQEPLGWVLDYHAINTGLAPLLKQLDHQILNNIPGLENPTSENLAYWIYEHAKKIFPELTQVTIMETPTTECSYPV
jgi:6-pyruvoyltetrahydropterin/6-carboxytetrahydropterin synthase